MSDELEKLRQRTYARVVGAEVHVQYHADRMAWLQSTIFPDGRVINEWYEEQPEGKLIVPSGTVFHGMSLTTMVTEELGTIAIDTEE